MAITTTYAFKIDNTYQIAEINEDVTIASNPNFYVVGGFRPGFGATIRNSFGFEANLTGAAPALAVLTNGNTVAVTENASGILYQVFDNLGLAVTGTNYHPVQFASKPDVTALNNGGFVWAFQVAYGEGFDIFLQFVDSAGVNQTLISPATAVNVDQDVRLATLANGNVALSWVRTLGGENEVWTAVYSQSGTLVKAATLVDTDGANNDKVQLAATANGYAMIYRGDFGLVDVRTFDASGNALGSVQFGEVFDAVGHPSITTLTNGFLLASWSTSGGYIHNTLIDPSTMSVLVDDIYDPSNVFVMVNPEVSAYGFGGFAQISLNLSTDEAEVSEITARRVITGDAAGNTITAGTDMLHHLIGGDGADKLYGSTLSDELDGGTGNDTLDGKGGNDIMRGGAGNDSYFVDSSADVITEEVGGGTDKVTSTAYHFILWNNVENLTLGNGAVDGYGNDGNNTITGNGANNYLSGGAGKDKLDGKDGSDTLDGGLGDDIYYVDNPGDVVVEDAATAAGGKDTINYNYSGHAFGYYTLPDNVENANLVDGNFALLGNSLNNTITVKGNFAGGILGGAGRDTLKGGAADDAIVGGTGADTLTGGGGADQFRFDVLETSANKDTIKDFSQADNDEINFESSAFEGLFAYGSAYLSLNPHVFALGTSAGDADDRVIYDQLTGNLWYDADGTGASAQILVAVLSNKPVLSADDIYII